MMFASMMADIADHQELQNGPTTRRYFFWRHNILWQSDHRTWFSHWRVAAGLGDRFPGGFTTRPGSPRRADTHGDHRRHHYAGAQHGSFFTVAKYKLDRAEVQRHSKQTAPA